MRPDACGCRFHLFDRNATSLREVFRESPKEDREALVLLIADPSKVCIAHLVSPAPDTAFVFDVNDWRVSGREAMPKQETLECLRSELRRPAVLALHYPSQNPPPVGSPRTAIPWSTSRTATSLALSLASSWSLVHLPLIDSNCRRTLAAFQIVLDVLPADDQVVEVRDAERASPVAQTWAHLLTMPCYTSEDERLED
jgi:hypothetical protein